MRSAEFGILLSTAASLGWLHTLIGVDHSLPFIALGKAGSWSLHRTLGVTAACGIAHVLSSVAIGVAGAALGVAVQNLLWLEDARGQLSAWLLIGFGLAYASRAILKRKRGHTHAHLHSHLDGTLHSHRHGHEAEHLHPHGPRTGRQLTPWVLFVVFAFGPCEALIPLMMAPALHGSFWAVASVVGVFGLATVITMLVVVTLGYLGLSGRRLSFLGPYLDPLAGFSIAGSGLAVLLLGV